MQNSYSYQIIAQLLHHDLLVAGKVQPGVAIVVVSLHHIRLDVLRELGGQLAAAGTAGDDGNRRQ